MVAKPLSPGTPSTGSPDAAGLRKQVVAERRQADIVGEGRQRQLTDHGGFHGSRRSRQHLPCLVDGHIGRVRRQRDAIGETQPVKRHHLTFRIRVERAGTLKHRATVRRFDAEPALAVQRHVEPVAGLCQLPLHMHGTHGGRSHAKAEMGTLWQHRPVGGGGRALHPVGLVEQVGELRPRPLETGRVDVGDVVGDHVQILLLGVHAGGGDSECAHRVSSDGHA